MRPMTPQSQQRSFVAALATDRCWPRACKNAETIRAIGSAHHSSRRDDQIRDAALHPDPASPLLKGARPTDFHRATFSHALGRDLPVRKSKCSRSRRFPGLCPVTNPLQSLPGRISTGRFGRTAGAQVILLSVAFASGKLSFTHN